MAAQVKAGFICDYALTSEDGKLSAIGMFSNINFPSLPNAYPRFFVVVILNLDVGTHAVSFGIVDPFGQQMLEPQPPQELEVQVPGADTNLVIDFNGLPFAQAGIHQVQLFVGGVLVHAIPLNVQAFNPQTGLPPQAN